MPYANGDPTLGEQLDEDDRRRFYTKDILREARQDRDEIKRLRATIDRLLTCGNHIATHRTGQWPDYPLDGLTREQQCELALRRLGATREYDVWCCWSGMMQARDELKD
jgi:hypothetical protein